MKEINVSKKIEKLIESGNKAFDLLLEEVKKPIDPDLQDDTPVAIKQPRMSFEIT